MTCRILNVYILVGNVVYVSVASGRTGPCLESGAVLSVQESNVLHVCVGDVVFDTGILTNGTHADAVGTVAPQVLDVDVGRVGFGREAIVANIDTGV